MNLHETQRTFLASVKYNGNKDFINTTIILATKGLGYPNNNSQMYARMCE